MAGELSKILDHIETIDELDLEGVPPTTHVVEVANALRADEPRPCLPREVALASAPDAHRGGLPRPQPAGGMSRRRRRSPPRRPPTRSSAGEVDRRRALRRLPRARRRRRAQRVRLGRRRAAPEGDDGPLGRAARRQGPLLHRGRAEPGRLEDPRGLPAAVHGDRRPQLATPARRCSARPTRTSSPWARRTRTPPTGRCSTRGTARACPAARSGGSAAAVAAGHRPVGARHRHRRLDPPARRAVRDRRPQADLRRRLALRDDRLRLVARPGRAADPRRHRRRAAVHATWSARDRATRPRSAFPEAIALPSAERPRRHPPRRARRSSRGEGIEPGVLDALPRDAEARRGARRDRRDVRAAARAACAQRLLRDRARPRHREPRPLRRRPLRPAPRRRRRPARRCTRETRHDGFGAEVKRRILIGTYALSSGYYDAYYGRAQQVRTKIAEDFTRPSTKFDFIVTPTAPSVAFELGAKTDDPLAMYLNDYCTVPMPLAGIPAISIPCGLSRGPAGRLPARRPGVQREPDPRRRLRARAGDRLRREAGRRMTAPSSPSSAWRSTSSSRRGRRCSAACEL